MPIGMILAPPEEKILSVGLLDPSPRRPGGKRALKFSGAALVFLHLFRLRIKVRHLAQAMSVDCIKWPCCDAADWKTRPGVRKHPQLTILRK